MVADVRQADSGVTVDGVVSQKIRASITGQRRCDPAGK
jgi:hypothetical protein